MQVLVTVNIRLILDLLRITIFLAFHLIHENAPLQDVSASEVLTLLFKNQLPHIFDIEAAE